MVLSTSTRVSVKRFSISMRCVMVVALRCVLVVGGGCIVVLDSFIVSVVW